VTAFHLMLLISVALDQGDIPAGGDPTWMALSRSWPVRIPRASNIQAMLEFCLKILSDRGPLKTKCLASTVFSIAFSVLKLDIRRTGIDTPVAGVGHADTETPDIPVDLDPNFELSDDPPTEA